jgi:hypothetical protein
VKARVLLGALGIAAAAYGGWSLLGEGLTDVVTTALWLAGGVVLHDFVLVPLTLGVCWLGARVLPAGRRAAVAVGLVVLGTLTLLAVPVLGGWGANRDNPTILGRDYSTGWLVVATLTVAGVLAGPILSGVLTGRRSRGQGARRR